ncbi:Uncharacterized protein SCF082_LOCUS14446, partial [Durusdinium trenchii]
MLWPPDIWVLGRRRLKPGAGGGDPTPMSAGFLTHPASAGGAEVLFAGDWRVEERSLASIARHLVHPLKATVLAVLSASPRGSDHEVNRTRGSKAARAVQAKGVLKRFFPALAGVRWVEDLSTEALRSLVAPKALALYETLGGGAVAPLRRSALGGQLHSLRKMQLAWRMVECYERKRKRRFKWLLYSRLDLIWVADHPPLRLFEPPDAVWTVPLAGAQEVKETIFAANDWHGLVPRASRFVAAYFGRWALLRKGLPWQPLLEPEELLASVCHWLRIPLGLFDATFSLASCRRWT